MPLVNDPQAGHVREAPREGLWTEEPTSPSPLTPPEGSLGAVAWETRGSLEKLEDPVCVKGVKGEGRGALPPGWSPDPPPPHGPPGSLTLSSPALQPRQEDDMKSLLLRAELP